MAIRTPPCDLVDIEYPIVLGGMMGISDGRLTAAVSEAGGLGTLSTATFGPDGTRSEIEKIASLTDKPFSLNLPIFHPMVPELVKVVKKCAEESRIAIRNIRREANDRFKKKEKEHSISEDQMHDKQDEVQKMTDKFIETIDEIVVSKEKEIMEI